MNKIVEVQGFSMYWDVNATMVSTCSRAEIEVAFCLLSFMLKVTVENFPVKIVMVALCNRADRYIFILFMVALCNRADHIYFHPVSSFFFFFFLA